MIEPHGPVPVTNRTIGRPDPQTGVTQDIDSIVLHTMVGWISAANARFHNPSAQVSAHYGIRIDGTVWQWVDDNDTAYHAGMYYENLRSIGIEHEDGGDYNGIRPEALYIESAKLVADLCRLYAIPCVRGTGGPGIYDHRQIVPTGCPDALDTNRIIREAAALLATDFTIKSPPRCSFATFTGVLAGYGSPALAEADACFNVCVSAGVDPAIALAFFAHESGCGTKFNAAPPGIRWGNLRWHPEYTAFAAHDAGGYATYPSFALAVAHFCQHITSGPYANLLTVSQVVPVWAPAGDGNTPVSYIADVNGKVASWQSPQGGDMTRDETIALLAEYGLTADKGKIPAIDGYLGNHAFRLNALEHGLPAAPTQPPPTLPVIAPPMPPIFTPGTGPR